MTEFAAETEVVETEAQRQDRARRKAVVQIARRFLTRLGGLARQLQVHADTNNAVQGVLKEVLDDFALLMASNQATVIVFAEGHTFVNGVWVRTTGRAWESAVYLTGALDRRNARGVRFNRGAGPAQILAFTHKLRESAAWREPGEARDEDIGIPGIQLLLKPEDAEENKDRAKFREQASEVFKEALLALDRKAAPVLNVYQRRRQRALVLRLVQMAEETPEDLLILTTVRDATLPLVAHNLMTTILAISLGRLMDLRRRDLVRLGVCALNHNVGEALLPEGLLAMTRKLSANEREELQRHPLMGMRHLLEHYGYDIPIIERALASVEHHIAFDGASGYPELGHGAPHAFARMIAIADMFNALVSERPQRSGFPPDQAMKLVTRKSASLLDPLLVRLFVRMIGRYPPGSLVELDTGEYGLVIGPGAGLEPLTRPRVLLLTDDVGLELEEPVAVDLGERHERRRAWLRTVVRTQDPSNLAAPVSRYLFADRVERRPLKLDIHDEELRARRRTTGDLPRFSQP